MIANRVQRLEQEALAKGETYHDMRKPTLLESGYSVRLRRTDTGPVVTVLPKKNEAAIDEQEALLLASEALGAPARLFIDGHKQLEFIPE
jgi:hypothetical protein